MLYPSKRHTSALDKVELLLREHMLSDGLTSYSLQ